MTRKLTSLEQLDLRLEDARSLIAFHGELSGDGPGRRYGYESLNRSAVLLAVAAWENFCEDLARRNAAALARRLKTSADLPRAIRESLIQWIYEAHKMESLTRDSREAIWSITGSGWRAAFREFSEAKVGALNTPNSDNISALFKKTIGIRDITQCWRYRRWDREVYVERLDNLLQTRHRVAHGVITETVGKTKAKEAVKLVSMLAHWMDGAIASYFRTLDLQGKKAKIRPA